MVALGQRYPRKERHRINHDSRDVDEKPDHEESQQKCQPKRVVVFESASESTFFDLIETLQILTNSIGL